MVIRFCTHGILQTERLVKKRVIPFLPQRTAWYEILDVRRFGSIDHTRQSGESADEISGRVPMANEESADPK
jgi:hypothetical protein